MSFFTGEKGEGWEGRGSALVRGVGGSHRGDQEPGDPCSGRREELGGSKEVGALGRSAS